MARVYLAVMHAKRGMRKLVVLKIPRDEVLADAHLAGMFVDEARLAMRLNHRNIVQTHEVIEEDGRDILAMEYLDGQTLSSILARCRRKQLHFPLEMHLRVVLEALNGLHYAHELRDFDGRPLNIVHRDTSPQNIFVTFDGEVKLLDFGVAKASISSTVTRAGTLKGKLRYMPPEQLVPAVAAPVDRRADIYAIGVVLWEAATGTKLWDKLSDLDLMKNVMAQAIPPPGEVAANVNPRLDAIVRKALAFKREDRYENCTELQAELEEFAATLPRSSVADVARFTAELFLDARLKRNAILEAQLARSMSDEEDSMVLPPGALDATESIRIPPVPMAALSRGPMTQGSVMAPTSLPEIVLPKSSGILPLPTSSDRPSVPSGTMVSGRSGTLAATLPSGPLVDRRGSRKGLIAAGVALVGVVGLSMALKAASKSTAKGEVPTPVENSAAVSAAQAPVAASASTSVSASATPAEERPLTLSFRARPDNAALVLDGELLKSNPATLHVARDEKVHALSVTAPGHIPQSIELHFNADKDMSFVLDKEPAPLAVPPPLKPRWTPPPVKTAKPPPPATAAPPTAAPPPTAVTPPAHPTRQPRKIDDKL